MINIRVEFKSLSVRNPDILCHALESVLRFGKMQNFYTIHDFAFVMRCNKRNIITDRDKCFAHLVKDANIECFVNGADNTDFY